MQDFFQLYYKYVGVNEAPANYHRWAALSLVGTLIARNVYVPFGPSNIYPNQYILLTGNPGARKGTAIKYADNLLRDTGYNFFAPDRNAKEAMWRYMADQVGGTSKVESLTDLVLEPECSQLYIIKDELVDFLGLGSDELVTNLANLWNNLPEFSNPKERSENIKIIKPTINLLGGITPGGIAAYFGALAEEGGFFSRTLFIYGTNGPDKVTWPTGVDAEAKESLLEILEQVAALQGPLILSEEVRNFIDIIYKSAPPIMDRRLSYYVHRRLIHLLKLCIIVTATRGTRHCTVDDVILANTILFAAELQMPQALGEYGKARNSESTSHVFDYIRNAEEPVSVRNLWKAVRTDLNKYDELLNILNGLMAADKIQQVKLAGDMGTGYLPVLKVENRWKPGLVDMSLLTMEEQTDGR